jgi:nucleoside-diphosphate-sugar epimerase
LNPSAVKIRVYELVLGKSLNTTTIALVGSTGFIGQHLLAHLLAREGGVVRVLVRDDHLFRGTPLANLVLITGDLTDPGSLEKLLTEGCVLVNLAHLSTSSQADNLAVANNILNACAANRVARLVHCSTAVVAGNVTDGVVTEKTECRPSNNYEAAKLAVERLFLQGNGRAFETTVLRPTAVFGPGGKNLLKLASDLVQRPAVVNFAKSCLQGRRRMNLVHVDNVISALSFLINARHNIDGEIYIVSDDESPLNNYRDVEQHLAHALGIPYYPLPPVAMPRAILELALKMAGRTNANPYRVYDGSKLMRAGLKKPMPFEQGLASFASWYRSSTGTDGGSSR